jgi:small subunit ribosomal protein S1
MVASWEFMDEDGTVLVSPGDEVDVLLEEAEGDDGRVVISKEKADRLKIWDDISKAYKADEAVEGMVLSRVKGGLAVDIGVKAFLPGSQVDLRPVRNLEHIVGQRLQFKIIKFNKRRANIVLSRRALLESERKKMRETTLQTLAPGQIVDGVIKNLTDYGAFIDLGGIDGLLHVTDMSWGRVNHPSEIFHVGDEIKVKVLKFDSDNERVSLGLKQIQPDPVDRRVDALPDRQAHLGPRGVARRVRRVRRARARHRGPDPRLRDVVDQAHQAPVEGRQRRRHGRGGGARRRRARSQDLARHEADRAESVERDRAEVPGRHARVGRGAQRHQLRRVRRLEEGIDGLVHVSDISWTEQIKHPSEKFNKGDVVEAVVLKIDKENEKFSLGIKQLQANPWKRAARQVPGRQRGDRPVTNVADFGAFVKLEEGIEGLIYSNELAAERVDNPAEVVQPGSR